MQDLRTTRTEIRAVTRRLELATYMVRHSLVPPVLALDHYKQQSTLGDPTYGSNTSLCMRVRLSGTCVVSAVASNLLIKSVLG